MRTDKVNQHYVPKFYLKHFSYANNQRQIGLFNLAKSLFVQRAKLKTQASGNFFYGEDGEVEDMLSDLEGVFATIVREYLNNEFVAPPMTSDKVDMLFFLIHKDIRNPVSMEQRKHIFNLVKDHLVSMNETNSENETVKGIGAIADRKVDLRENLPGAMKSIQMSMDL